MRIVSAVFAAGLVLGVAGTAGAGGYASLGVGGGAMLTGTVSQHFDAQDSSSGRIAIGQRTGRIALEAALFGTDMTSVSGLGGRGEFSTMSLGVELKYYFPLSGQLEAYGKGGLSKTWLVTEDANPNDIQYSGRGWNAGAGLQYNFSLSILAQGAVWLDYNYQKLSLTDKVRADLDGTARMWTLGLTVGF